MQGEDTTEDGLRELLRDPRWTLPTWPDAQVRVRRAARRQRLRAMGVAIGGGTFAIAAIVIPLTLLSGGRTGPVTSIHQGPPAAASAHCPVTRPMRHLSAPTGAVTGGLGVPNGWYGNAALRVAVPTRGVLPAGRPYGSQWPGEWGTKFPWWRLIPGKLTITARRLDGPSAGFHAEIAGPGYGKLGFQPSGLIWPEPGCWQVTGTVASHSLTIVVRVRAVHS
jgi:hypothetical protein